MAALTVAFKSWVSIHAPVRVRRPDIVFACLLPEFQSTHP
ncbi:hypothetical protein HMPREF3038_01504 [Akkermansia sp. KLE1797]|nr:hypothetical protein HMPREF3038_01504 [Akkermansia sp. KLE1797]